MQSTAKHHHGLPLHFALALAAVLAAASAVHADVIADAEAFWTFDSDYTDSSGGTTHDGTGYGDVAITNMPSTFVAGGGGLHLDGSGDYVDFGAGISETGPLTVSAWMKPEVLSYSGGSAATIIGGDNHCWLRIENDNVYARFSTGSGHTGGRIYTDPDFSPNEWQHFVMTRDASNQISIYRDLQSVATGSSSGTFNPTYVGLKAPGVSDNYYKGLIDEVGIWSRVLDSSEIEELFDRGSGAFPGVLGVVAANIDVPADGGASGTAVVRRSSRDRVTITNVNMGDYEIAIDGNTLDAADGILMATVRQNTVSTSIGDRYATVEAARDGPFAGTSIALATQKMGSGVQGELSASTAAAWFPFADGWMGGHVNPDGTLYAATAGIDSSMVTVVEPSTSHPAYDLVMPLINPSTGMLFVIGSSDDSAIPETALEHVHIASTMPLAGGNGWRIAVISNRATNTTSSEAGEFSFLYLPFDTPGLVGGRINGSGTEFSPETSVGDFTITRTATGQYNLTLDDYTPDDGVLLLSSLDGNSNHTYPQDDYLTYEASLDGQSFLIWNQDLNGSASSLTLANMDFVFAFVPMAVPEPAGATLLLIGGLGLGLFRRRRRRIS